MLFVRGRRYLGRRYLGRSYLGRGTTRGTALPGAQCHQRVGTRRTPGRQENGDDPYHREHQRKRQRPRHHRLPPSLFSSAAYSSAALVRPIC